MTVCGLVLEAQAPLHQFLGRVARIMARGPVLQEPRERFESASYFPEMVSPCIVMLFVSLRHYHTVRLYDMYALHGSS